MKENAILMAAGLGSRMRPLTKRIPKPLVKVNGTPMIETLINSIQKRGINKIFVVVGYLGENFIYLEKKYTNLFIIENKDYQRVNNISSIYALSEELINAETNYYICEADLYIKDETVFDTDHNHSCYYGKMVEGHSDDWVFDIDESGRIIRVGKVGDDCFNMVGISWFLKKDAQILGRLIKSAYHSKGYEDLFWDEVVNCNLDKLNMIVHEIKPNQILEIDTLKELSEIDSSYKGMVSYES